MKELIKQYLDQGMSRRQLVSGLSALGMSTVAAKAVAQNLAPIGPGAARSSAPRRRAGAIREVEGNGGALFVEQLKAAGVEHIFFNPSTGDHPIFDALVDEPGIHLIKGIQEGAVTAMADGYARASGRTGVVIVANIGLPNAMTQMVNSWKDQIPLLVAVASIDQNALGRDQFQETDHHELMTQPITKWYWQAQTTAAIAETTRRGLKFASTPPCGPVFLSLPTNTLNGQAKSQIWEQAANSTCRCASVPTRRMSRKRRAWLLEAQESAHQHRRRDHLVQRQQGTDRARGTARPAGRRTNRIRSAIGRSRFRRGIRCSSARCCATCAYPGKPDVLLNLGNSSARCFARHQADLHPARPDEPRARSAGRSANGGRSAACHRRSHRCDQEHGDRIAAQGHRRAARGARARVLSSKWQDEREAIARALADSTPISMERLGLELEQDLDRDTCYVADVDSGKTMDPLMTFGGDDKQYFGTGPNVLGWGMAAGFGVKLARPDVPVVSVVGDGSFLFSGPQPLWSMARYKAPVTVIVLNNHSYNNERNRIWNGAGRQFDAARDMTCYNGSPDVDFAKAADAFGVDGETVKDPSTLSGALSRAKAATVEGRPYLLDIHIKREGIGAVSEWYPPYSIAGQRTRKV